MSPAICSIGELIERHVAVERVDHPVAVLPDVAAVVLLVAVGVGVAGEVEPRPRPALAVVRRRQQPIDDALVGVGRRVGDERVDFRGRRRKAGQVERDAAQQRRLSASGDGDSCLALEPRQHEPIDRIARPGRRATAGSSGRTGLLYAQCSGSAAASAPFSAAVLLPPVVARRQIVSAGAPGIDAP